MTTPEPNDPNRPVTRQEVDEMAQIVEPLVVEADLAMRLRWLQRDL
ncbi:hypothetical protein [Lentzea sp. NPDC059081]